MPNSSQHFASDRHRLHHRKKTPCRRNHAGSLKDGWMDLGSSAARRAGSSPVPGTNIQPPPCPNLALSHVCASDENFFTLVRIRKRRYTWCRCLERTSRFMFTPRSKPNYDLHLGHRISDEHLPGLPTSIHYDCLKKTGGYTIMKGNMIARAMLCLAVLTLVSATALAEDNSKSTITINGGRNTVFMKAPAHVQAQKPCTPAKFYDLSLIHI